MIGSLRLIKKIRCGLEYRLFTRDQRASRALVPRNDAAGHSETLNGRILPATAATERVDFVEALAALFRWRCSDRRVPQSSRDIPLSLVTANIEPGRDLGLKDTKLKSLRNYVRVERSASDLALATRFHFCSKDKKFKTKSYEVDNVIVAHSESPNIRTSSTGLERTRQVMVPFQICTLCLQLKEHCWHS